LLAADEAGQRLAERSRWDCGVVAAIISIRIREFGHPGPNAAGRQL